MSLFASKPQPMRSLPEVACPLCNVRRWFAHCTSLPARTRCGWALCGNCGLTTDLRNGRGYRMVV